MSDTSEKTNLLGLSPAKMEEFFLSIGEKKFRAQQMLKWIHQYGESDFEKMTNMGKALRAKLAEVSEIVLPEVVYEDFSKDGTRKWVMRMPGGSAVETVYIPEKDRGTLCVSSQIGCALDCSFCSTGKQGFNRDLTVAEIIGQLYVAAMSFHEPGERRERRITNVVMMGMGEPLLNFDNVVDAMNLMMDDNAYGLSKRRVTLSTSGVVPMIDKLGDVTDVSLAISLHAPNDELRNTLVPLNKKYPLSELISATNRYLGKLPDKRKATIEYTLIDGVNDEMAHAEELAELMKLVPCKINLIPFNPFPNSGYRRPSNNRVYRFRDYLISQGHVVTIRSTRGDDIDAACGQLVGKVEDRTRRSQRYIDAVQIDSEQGGRAS
ncbi:MULTISPECIES: 23S rRNA (adenine(2503)-C(2))-methyltransferase RlmN [Thalassolituus]|jgi:23S rRNA (adenine2503-C2)-methyltransferase|uniref:Dual-specificity RNA methyltransferase RlmN n=1 Tax=Thalassolituus maritimus TaxID=484498 RepID=A0A1N7J4T1_9GAMM|nr:MULTISPECIES: 23S rRNA (adenine(2503)-C(2))-methyltransferase RlmN [Thalassolituus]MAG44201.1 23S rRNA (adenine(2503)-C(2))-methyltransferase RlmN [Oceanospirillaceae bacterium]MEC8908891.1 23S rRNA (adenine(2503)-C(2))-methyltransferase RlmN [Pseudomonadota bacterium]HCG78503.1 23S rRNA (adenine(2503)-C(2))-methyltransferase RlmN [Oceanospirillales bacterium]MAX86901.1 23S rRNA (adenine(2503)-C(2))-methyltransferase RlmN [Oceanospirillaceae bacterium]MED5441570.1 23S rRNA (adenine(2503)-C(|tara:strand:- start:5807 stop:6940 length:1134 start_codon:yes stop_codon:yes gene_type:complete